MSQKDFSSALLKSVVIFLSVLFFLLSIDLMGLSIGSLAGDSLADFIDITSNPFVGLFIGLMSTALLQSSSTTTSIAVAAVASGAISLQGAIPIILGANIGTTITSTIVSMGYISKATEFRKAVAAGTVHDFFNIIMVLLLFPLEASYHILERCSLYITSFFNLENGVSAEPGFESIAFFDTINGWLVALLGPIPSLLLGILILFLCIKLISKWLYTILIGKTKDRFKDVVFKTKYRAFGWGLAITSLAQSSSLTTSLIVPLVATGKVKIKKAFHFILGANIGTTITALLAASFQSEAAISLAIVHLLFNLIGVTIFLLIPFVSTLPVYLAKKLGELTFRLRVAGFVYILIAFFLIPFTLIYLSSSIEKEQVALEMKSED
ncbi:MAG: Na/Pi symporter [Cyclobacteriaceae bacterium]